MKAQIRVNTPVKSMDETNRGFRPLWSMINMQNRYEGISEKVGFSEAVSA